MKKQLMLAGILMIISGITHVSQIFFYDEARTLIGVSAFGVAYFLIGVFLLRQNRIAIWVGAILPAIGGMGGTYRLFVLQPNPFSAFHVLIDLVVVPICIYTLIKLNRGNNLDNENS